MNENTGVNGDGTIPASGSPPDENISAEDPQVGGQPLNDGSEPGHEQAVPYDRFKQQLDGKKVAEQHAANLQAQLNNTQEAYRQMAQNAVASAATAQPVEATPDVDDQLVRNMLGDDETGKNAYEVIDRMATKRAADAVQTSQNSMYQQMNNMIDYKLNGVANSMQTEKTLAAWRGTGIISSDDERKIATGVQQQIAANPHLAGQQDAVLKFVYGDMVSKGEIAGGTRMGGTPLQGGGGGAPAGAPADLAKDVQERFKSLQGKSVDELRKTLGGDLFKIDGDTDTEIQRGSYRMG